MLVIPLHSIKLHFFIKKLEKVEPNLVSFIKSFFIFSNNKYKHIDKIFHCLLTEDLIFENISYLVFPIIKYDNIFSKINYKYLRILKFGLNVSNINNNLFKNCFFLEKIYFPPGNVITFIGPNAFRNCYELKKIISKINCHIIFSNTFNNCFKLEEIILGDSLKKIETNSFVDCLNLENVYIPQDVYHMGFSSFQNCHIKHITIPYNFKELREFIFINCCVEKYTIYNDFLIIIIIFLIFCLLFPWLTSIS